MHTDRFLCPAGNSARRAHRAALALVAVALLLVGATLLFDADAEGVRVAGTALPELCPSAALGVACPGCGSTRAAVHLMHGRMAEAWRMQPGVFPLAALLGLVLLPAAWRPRARRAAFAAAASLFLFSWLIA